MSKRKPPKGGIATQEYELVPVAALRPHPRNVNESDLGAIITSIKANQFFGAVLVQRSTSYILAGTHRWRGAQECGLEVIPTIWADVDDETALRIMLADNRTCRLGHDDPACLAELLQGMLAETGSLDGTGFDGEDLEALLEDLAGGPVTDPLSDGAGGGGGDEPTSGSKPVTCPHCGHEFYSEF